MDKNSGFTLIETLIAMVIFAITMLTLFSSFNAFTSIYDFVKFEITQSNRFRLGLRVMADDLKQVFLVYPPRYTKPGFDSNPDPYRFVGSLSELDADRFSELSFATTNHISFGLRSRSGVAKVTYYVHSHDGQTDLHRSDQLLLSENKKNPCMDPVLFSNISGFKLSYADENDEEMDLWDSESAISGYRLPVRVTIQVRAKWGEKKIIQEACVLLPVNRESTE